MTARRLSELQRAQVVTAQGERLGRVFDVATARTAPDREPALTALLVGRSGLARRLGIARHRAAEIPVERIVRIDGDTIVVGD